MAAGTLGRWYTPSIVATEQERENVAFGTLTTADEVKSVVLPENGLMVIGYMAIVKSSVSEAGAAAIFLGATQLKAVGSTTPVVQEVKTTGTSTTIVSSSPIGLVNSGNGSSYVTTGMSVSSINIATGGGLCFVFAAAGTYNVSVQYKATSGKVFAKERKLWVGVIGV